MKALWNRNLPLVVAWTGVSSVLSAVGQNYPTRCRLRLWIWRLVRNETYGMNGLGFLGSLEPRPTLVLRSLESTHRGRT